MNFRMNFRTNFRMRLRMGLKGGFMKNSKDMNKKSIRERVETGTSLHSWGTNSVVQRRMSLFLVLCSNISQRRRLIPKTLPLPRSRAVIKC